MSRIIIDILPDEFWFNLFVLFFLIGLIFTLITILGGIMSDDSDMDHDHDVDHDIDHDMDVDHDIDMDHDMDVDHDIDMDHDMDVDHDIDMDHDMDVDHDMDMDHDIDNHIDTNLSEHHYEINQNEVSSKEDLPKTRHMMGNISSFMLLFGTVGWTNFAVLSDEILGVAIFSGYVFSRIYAWILASYAKTTNNPIYSISQGDFATISSSVTYEKAGLVNVKRKDGVISTVLAKGAFPHDSFEKGDKGHVWGKEGSFYLVTHVFWNTKQEKSSKALDIQKPKKAMEL